MCRFWQAPQRQTAEWMRDFKKELAFSLNFGMIDWKASSRCLMDGCGVPCVKIYILCAHKWKTKVYISVSGVCTTTFVCARLDSLFDRQLCVYHVNQYTPCPPKLCAFKSATSLLLFRPNSWHHVHFLSCTLKATRYIYIYVKCQEVSPHGSQQVVL